MKRIPQGAWLAITLIVITGANVAFRLSRPSGRTLAVSSLELGTKLPAFTLEPLQADRATPPSGCRLLVVFSSTCPHCHAAARRDTLVSADRLPVVWIAADIDRGADAFAKSVPPTHAVFRSSNAFQALRINAVPAAFLVDNRDRVREVWVYQGNESQTELRSKCT